MALGAGLRLLQVHQAIIPATSRSIPGRYRRAGASQYWHCGKSTCWSFSKPTKAVALPAVRYIADAEREDIGLRAYLHLRVQGPPAPRRREYPWGRRNPPDRRGVTDRSPSASPDRWRPERILPGQYHRAGSGWRAPPRGHPPPAAEHPAPRPGSGAPRAAIAG